MRVGIGYDVHKLVEDRDLIIGGVKIDYDRGLLGHSDADVLTHALIDAIFGALGEGDLGRHFPDTDPRFKGADSLKLLAYAKELMDKRGYRLGNADCTIIAQAPKMAPHLSSMIDNFARVLDTDKTNINVKATTEEGLGFTGSKEGISSQAIVLLVENRQETKLNRSYKIAVAGIGYVGLSISILLAQANRVVAVDVAEEKVNMINKKKSPIHDDYIEDYLANKDLDLVASLDTDMAYRDADYVVIAAPTNYDAQKNYFDTSAIEAVIEKVLQVNKEAIIVIKSTIPVGYTESVRAKYKTKNF